MVNDWFRIGCAPKDKFLFAGIGNDSLRALGAYLAVLICIYVLCIAITPVSGYMYPDKASLYQGSIYFENISNNSIDGNLATHTELSTSNGIISLNFTEPTAITSCELTTNGVGGNRHYFYEDFEGNTSNTSWMTSEIPAFSGEWNEFNMPEPYFTTLFRIRGGVENWFYISELQCKGYNATYTDEIAYNNVTFNIKSSDGINKIENCLIEVSDNIIGWMWSGRTNTEGNVTSMFMPINVYNYTYKMFATGYGYKEGSFLNSNPVDITIQEYLNPQNQPNSTNYIKINFKDASNNLYLENTQFSFFDYNKSEWWNGTSPLGTENIEFCGFSKSRELIYDDKYMVTGWLDGYETNNISFLHTSGSQVETLYLTPSKYINESNELWVDVIDGGTNAYINDAEIDLYDEKYKEWLNITSPTGKTSFSKSGKNSQYPIVYGRGYNVTASATGYQTGWLAHIIFKEPYSYDVSSPDKKAVVLPLTFGGNIPTGNFSVTITALDSNSNPISGVNIYSTSGDMHHTNNLGTAQFVLPEGTYQFTGKKSGYSDGVTSVTGVENHLYYLNIIMNSGAITPTPTITSTISVTPTRWDNVTPPDEMVCVRSGPYPAEWGFFDYVHNFIACNGVKGQSNQNAVLGLIIIMICALVLSKYGKQTGAIIGGICGTVITIFMGLLPVWVLVAIVIIAGVIFGHKMTGDGK